MSSKIKNIPKNIYLQVDSDEDNSEIDFKDLEGITWCADKINDTDLKFQLNETGNRLFTKAEMIDFAMYASNIDDDKVKREVLETNFDIWAFVRK